MNKIETLELELAARKIVDGTGLAWWHVVSIRGYHTVFSSPPIFDYPDASQYELALGIIEGKPVWEGDIIYNECGVDFPAKRTYEYPGCWSWNPPKPKTVMVELTVEDVELWSLLPRTKDGNPYCRLSIACCKAWEKLNENR